MSNELILAVDDQAAVLEVFEAVLGREGYRLHKVTDPAEALVIYRQRWRQTALVLIDYHLPGMLGDELFARLRQINPQVRALLITGGCPETLEQMLLAGLAGVVLKPFHLDALLKAVRQALAQPPPTDPAQ